ncbi:MAG TPA: formyltransferase family protein [Gaiellaceae bacterium]|nr:formyltransferase family protein [Gaiellaceae bacterium]
MTSWRVVVVTRILPVALGFIETVRAAGHEPVAMLSIRDTENRYGTEFTLDALLAGVPAELDVLLPAQRSSIAPLLASVQPDLVVCMGFPWKIPADALAVPTHGWLNGHPSQLPRHRGPIPVAWAIRNGDTEVGLTFHRMDAELDTGPILAQATMEIGEYTEPDVFYPRMGQLMMSLLGNALAQLARGEEGTLQDGGEYESFFTDDDAWLDFSRPADELHRLVWSWRYAITRGELRGALAEVDGETVRVLASSLREVDGAQRVDCGDGPLWVVKTEPVEELSAAEATRASAPARATR